MTSFTRRFIESQDPELIPGFDRLYGGPSFRAKLASVAEGERDDAMVEEYIRQIKSAGSFRFVSYTPVFQPQINDVHFHLIYATRNEKGPHASHRIFEKSAGTICLALPHGRDE
jgi:hypothetical protein